MKQKITDDLYYVGESDQRQRLFEGVYPIERGVSYNSYVLLDEKTALFDAADASVEESFLQNVQSALQGRDLDYVIVHHMEPDHSAALKRVLELYPKAKMVASAKALQLAKQFFGSGIANAVCVKEGDELSLGKHVLQFIAAPMVHWPEVLFSFDKTDGVLFSADAFGTFGALHGSLFADEVQFERDFSDEARRYYFNIVGKYGAQVQAVLKKAAGLEINMICPLHGPVWRRNLSWYLEKYRVWSGYCPEEKGVAIFCGSIYGHTLKAARDLCGELASLGVPCKVYDVAYLERSYLVAEAFRYSHVVFASVTYNNGIFTPMKDFLDDLKEHNFQNKKYALMENGSWAPQSGKLMGEALSSLKNMEKIGQTVTFLSSPSEKTKEELSALALELSSDFIKE